MRNWWKWAVGAVAVAASALQLTNPPLTNPTVVPGHDLLATNPPPPEIASLLRSACYDCHSDETRWPWYSRVAPISWMIADHVNQARDAMNFSDWPHGQVSRVRKRWRHIADMVQSGAMPLASYTWIHRDARLTAAQRHYLAKWAAEAASE